MLVDDVFATIGSTNCAERSFRNQTEMNVSFQDAAEVRALRCDLFAEHLAQDTVAIDAGEAVRLFAKIARKNATRHEAGDAKWQGLAFALDPATYAS
jgi:phosphatidylserine/phosphatidylglycerophosphate/cardiolipin synthase-like enzyme